jgi:hypothetical protein
MYTLRIIEKDGQVSNQSLGENYSVTYKATCKDYEKVASGAVTNERTYAIVVGNDGKVVFPIFDNIKYFIMTENGKTFEKL